MPAGFNIVDLAFLVVAAFFLIRAILRGFVREILGLVGLVAAIFASALLYQPLGELLERLSGFQAQWWPAVGFALVLAVVFAVFVYLGYGLSRLIHQGPFSGLDRLLGAGVGLIKGLLVSYLLLNLLLLTSPFQAPTYLKKSRLAPYVVQGGRYLVDLVPSDLTRMLQKRAGLLDHSSDFGTDRK